MNAVPDSSVNSRKIRQHFTKLSTCYPVPAVQIVGKAQRVAHEQETGGGFRAAHHQHYLNAFNRLSSCNHKEEKKLTDVIVGLFARSSARFTAKDRHLNKGITWLFSGILFICALVVSFAATTRAQINNIPEKSHVIIIIINKQGQMISRMRVLIIQAKWITNSKSLQIIM